MITENERKYSGVGDDLRHVNQRISVNKHDCLSLVRPEERLQLFNNHDRPDKDSRTKRQAAFFASPMLQVIPDEHILVAD